MKIVTSPIEGNVSNSTIVISGRDFCEASGVELKWTSPREVLWPIYKALISPFVSKSDNWEAILRVVFSPFQNTKKREDTVCVLNEPQRASSLCTFFSPSRKSARDGNFSDLWKSFFALSKREDDEWGGHGAIDSRCLEFELTSTEHRRLCAFLTGGCD